MRFLPSSATTAVEPTIEAQQSEANSSSVFRKASRSASSTNSSSRSTRWGSCGGALHSETPPPLLPPDTSLRRLTSGADAAPEPSSAPAPAPSSIVAASSIAAAAATAVFIRAGAESLEALGSELAVAASCSSSGIGAGRGPTGCLAPAPPAAECGCTFARASERC